MEEKIHFLTNNSIILVRNRDQEVNLNYTKIYDLSKIDKINDISLEEKTNLLITIKKILLITNEHICYNNIIEIIRYLILSTLIFFGFLLLYHPFYTSYYLTDEKKKFLNESTFFQKFYCYYFFEIFEVAFRIILNNIKETRIRKVMVANARSIINKFNEENNIHLFIDDYRFYLYIFRNAHFKHLFGNKELSATKNDNVFFQYVINYPNVRYYNWDRKILSDKENEIASNIIDQIKITEKEHIKKYGFTLILVWILYVLSFNSSINGEKLKCLFYRFISFVFTKIVSYFMSYSFKNSLSEKEEILSKNYLNEGYFIKLNFTVIQIYKLNNGYVDNSLNVNEIYKNINNDVERLNEKILEN